MKKQTLQILGIALVMVITFAQVNANNTKSDEVVAYNAADKITKAIWEDAKNTKLLTKEDTITHMVWNNQVNDWKDIVAQADPEYVAFAADLEEEECKSTDLADKITKDIWTTSYKQEKTPEDLISYNVW